MRCVANRSFLSFLNKYIIINSNNKGPVERITEVQGIDRVTAHLYGGEGRGQNRSQNMEDKLAFKEAIFWLEGL